MKPGEPFDAYELAATYASALEAAGIPHAIGGAIAFGIWSVPRTTKDVDLNVFVPPESLGPALEVLASVGVAFDVPKALIEARDGGQVVGWDGDCRVDLFLPSIPFSDEAMRTRVRLSFRGQPQWFLSPEAVCVFKLLFFRGKDLVDLERLIATQGKRLDAPYVRRWIADMMGEDDARVAKWDELCATFWREPPNR